MRTIRKASLAAAAALAIACSGGGGGGSTDTPRPPPREGAALLGASGRMTGGTLTADVRLGATFGAQKASAGNLTLSDPVLTR
jgi:hypothetical protein